jgi:hypothetical protein
MPNAPVDDVFRFLIIRAPQALAPSDRGRVVVSSDLRPTADGDLIARTDAEARAAGDRPEARIEFDARKTALAAQFVASKSFVGADERVSGQHLADVVDTMLDALVADLGANDDRLPAFHRAVAAAFGVNVAAVAAGQALARLESRAWNSLLASMVLKGRAAGERERLVRLVRACRAVRAVAEAGGSVGSPDGIRALLSARPALPRRIFLPDADAGAPDPRLADDTPRPDDGPLSRLADDLLSRFAARRRAIDEIAWAIKRLPAQGGGGLRPAPVARARADRSAAVRARPGLRTLTPAAAARFALADEDAARLSAQTRAVVADLGLTPGRDDAGEIVEALRAANAADTAVLFQAQGRRALLPFYRGSGGETRFTFPPSADLLPLVAGNDPRISGWGPERRSSARAMTSSAAGYSYVAPSYGTLGGTPSAPGQPAARALPVRPLGVGDLKVVRQTLLKYEAGEIAHIENVLRTERRRRDHRVLDTTEVTEVLETESTEEREKTFEQADRYELQREAQRTIQSDLSFKAGVTVSGGFGPVQVSSSVDFAYNQSTSESERTASTYAQNVTQRSVERIKERVRRERRTVRRTEIEEKNRHEFDNTSGAGHVVGIYRFVDKFYLGQVYNYGKRLMFEFMVPEPAAFYLWLQQQRALDVAGDLRPPPELQGLGPLSIQPDTYTQYVSLYQVPDVAPPPPQFVTIGRAFHQREESNPLATSSNDLAITKGYRAVRASHVYAAFVEEDDTETFDFAVFVADHIALSASNSYPLPDVTGTLPVSVGAVQAKAHILNVVVICERTEELLREWQQQTYEKILAAYQQQLGEYRERLATRQAAAVLAGTDQPAARNPLKNRELEREELKRGCLSLLAANNTPLASDLVTAVDGIDGWMDIPRALAVGPLVRFLEDSFDWENMTYLFYPYFWGARADWPLRAGLDDPDPLFEKFLRAGWARVILPVHRNYETGVLAFLVTGEPHAGSDEPTIEDEEFLALLAELADADDIEKAPVAEGDPFEIKIPTDLVILQEDGTLPDYSSAPAPGGP